MRFFVAAYRGACPERSVVSGHRCEVMVLGLTIAVSCRWSCDRGKRQGNFALVAESCGGWEGTAERAGAAVCDRSSNDKNNGSAAAGMSRLQGLLRRMIANASLATTLDLCLWPLQSQTRLPCALAGKSALPGNAQGSLGAWQLDDE